MPRIIIPSGRAVEYDRVGSGPPVLLIQGLGGFRSTWIEVVGALREKHTVITFDVRGYSGDVPETFEIGDLAADAVGLLAALETGPAAVVGHSQGGFIALRLAVTCPEQVAALVIAASAAYTDNYGRLLLSHWCEVAEQIGTAALKRELFLWGFSPEYINSRGRELRLLELVQQERPLALAAYLAHNKACSQHDVRSSLPGLKVPTLLLGGTSDIVMTLRHNQLLLRLIPGSRLVEFAGVGHHVFAEAPAKAIDCVQQFLGEALRPATEAQK